MTWVAWRLQRTETLIALGILALLAALLVPTGISMANAYHQDGLGACILAPKGSICGQKILDFQQRFQSIITLSDWFTLVPGLIGVLFATPFILDLEHGTYRLAWTQSIARRRWLLGKLGVPVVASLVAAGALILLLTWWRSPAVHLDGRLDSGAFDSEGTVVLGYTIFALGLALAVGAVWRRAAASLAVGFVAYFATRLLVDFKLRHHLVTPHTVTWRGIRQPHVLYNAEVLNTSIGRAGHAVGGGGGFLGGHVQLVGPGPNTIFHATYIPASDFWPLQLHETALFLGIGVILIAFAAWWTHQQRTA